MSGWPEGGAGRSPKAHTASLHPSKNAGPWTGELFTLHVLHTHRFLRQQRAARNMVDMSLGPCSEELMGYREDR